MCSRASWGRSKTPMTSSVIRDIAHVWDTGVLGQNQVQMVSDFRSAGSHRFSAVYVAARQWACINLIFISLAAG